MSTLTGAALATLLAESAGGNSTFVGTIVEIIVYAPELGSTDIATVEAYLHQKFGLPQ
jgi:hypothetical protein